MNRTFEDPRKTDLRERVELAVDAAGFELVEELVFVPAPDNSGLNGGILGDVQGIDGKGIRHAFYVRTTRDKPVPQWLASLAAVSHKMDGIRVHIVVEDVSTNLERSCRACGAGLLQIKSDGDYELVPIVDPSEYDPQRRSADFAARLKTLRRRLETKLDVNVKGLTDKYSKLGELTRGMTMPEQEKVAGALEAAIGRWKEWSESLSVLLDEAAATLDENLLQTIEKQIERGAVDP